MRQIFCAVVQYIKLLISIFVGFVASAKKKPLNWSRTEAFYHTLYTTGIIVDSVKHAACFKNRNGY